MHVAGGSERIGALKIFGCIQVRTPAVCMAGEWCFIHCAIPLEQKEQFFFSLSLFVIFSDAFNANVLSHFETSKLRVRTRTKILKIEGKNVDHNIFKFGT